MITKQEAGKVVKKFEMEPRHGKELIYKLTTAIPKGRGQLNCSDKFRNQLRFNDEQLKAAIKCSLRRPHFIAHLKSIGKIPEDDKD